MTFGFDEEPDASTVRAAARESRCLEGVATRLRCTHEKARSLLENVEDDAPEARDVLEASPFDRASERREA